MAGNTQIPCQLTHSRMHFIGALTIISYFHFLGKISRFQDFSISENRAAGAAMNSSAGRPSSPLSAIMTKMISLLFWGAVGIRMVWLAISPIRGGFYLFSSQLSWMNCRPLCDVVYGSEIAAICGILYFPGCAILHFLLSWCTLTARDFSWYRSSSACVASEKRAFSILVQYSHKDYSNHLLSNEKDSSPIVGLLTSLTKPRAINYKMLETRVITRRSSPWEFLNSKETRTRLMVHITSWRGSRSI